MARLVAPPLVPISFIATNVRGPQIPVYLAGCLMVDYMGMIPLGADLGFGAVISTYHRKVYVAFMAEPRLMPDVELMKAFVDDAFEELTLAAEGVAPERATAPARIPSQNKRLVTPVARSSTML
jgi:hypothetical protein